MNALLAPLSIFYAASQRGLASIRRTGMMGSPDRPVFYAAGDAVPWWAYCRWPLNIFLTFEYDCETFWDGSLQQVHPLWQDVTDALIRCNGRGQHVLLVGAPTCLNGKHRPRGPKPQPSRQHAVA